MLKKETKILLTGGSCRSKLWKSQLEIGIQQRIDPTHKNTVYYEVCLLVGSDRWMNRWFVDWSVRSVWGRILYYPTNLLSFDDVHTHWYWCDFKTHRRWKKKPNKTKPKCTNKIKTSSCCRLFTDSCKFNSIRFGSSDAAKKKYESIKMMFFITPCIVNKLYVTLHCMCNSFTTLFTCTRTTKV